VLSEFVALGLVAGVLAALLANVLSVLLAQRLFELDASFNLPLWIAGTLVGMGLVGLLGFFASRPILKTPPMQLLR
jgi:putative ABC transport system permease protein